ncbi:unnamed protein product [Phytophthora lilii]|uniref:Unnamed protein product n=1 Tax=Phytophthora lilii TaxID=2077276 RepID=A0A9W6YFU8_9STRA|nr:unnamed protein product [Phytophthora lilii]
MARKVWFQLVDEQSRRAFAGTAAGSVKSLGIKDVEDFRNKVHAEFDHTQPPGRAILAHVAPIQLKIYANTTAYEAKEKPLKSSAALEEDSTIGTLGGSKKNALIVEVPQEPQVLPDEKRQRTEAVDPRHLNDLNALVAIAHKLSGAKELRLETLLDTPTTIFGAAFDNGLFIAP